MEKEKVGLSHLYGKMFIVEFIIYGNVDEDKAKRAAELSMNKYCSVTEHLMKAGATIKWSVKWRRPEYHICISEYTTDGTLINLSYCDKVFKSLIIIMSEATINLNPVIESNTNSNSKNMAKWNIQRHCILTSSFTF